MVKITRIREYLIRDTSELAAVLGRLIRKRLWLNDHQWLRHYYVIITNLMIRILRDLIGQIRPDLFWRKDVISYSGRPPSRLDFLWYNEIIHHMVAFVVDESSRYDSLWNVRYRAISTMFSILVEILWSFINVKFLPGFVTLILKFSLKGFNLFIGFIQITLKFSLQAINPSCLLFSLIGSSLWCPQTGIQFLDLKI